MATIVYEEDWYLCTTYNDYRSNKYSHETKPELTKYLIFFNNFKIINI